MGKRIQLSGRVRDKSRAVVTKHASTNVTSDHFSKAINAMSELSLLIFVLALRGFSWDTTVFIVPSKTYNPNFQLD